MTTTSSNITTVLSLQYILILSLWCVSVFSSAPQRVSPIANSGVCSDDGGKIQTRKFSKRDDESSGVSMEKFNRENSEALSLLWDLYKSSDGWNFVNKKDGVTVERRWQPAGCYVDPKDRIRGGKHACVKSQGILDAPPEAVFSLFLDNSRVSEYNEHCVLVKDVEQFPHISQGSCELWSKIAWATSPKYGFLKARDFCSVVHFVKYSNGSYVILNRPAYHSKYPPSSDYVRATILLAGNLIEPIDRGSKTRLTQVAHVNPGGGADTPAIAWIINQLCAVGPPAFIRKLEAVARTSVVNSNAVFTEQILSVMLSKTKKIRGALKERLNMHGPSSPFSRESLYRLVQMRLPFTNLFGIQKY